MAGLELDIGQCANHDQADVPETYVENKDKAHAMALASNRNELNRVAFKKIAEGHMLDPDLEVSPLKAQIFTPEANPYARTVVATGGNKGYSYTFTSAIDQARKERAAADQAAEIASCQYDILQNT